MRKGTGDESSDDIVSRPAEFVQPYGPGPITLMEPADTLPQVLLRSNRLSWKGWKLVLARTVLDFGPMALMDRGATMTYYTITAFAPSLLAFYSIVTLLFPTDQDELREMIGGFINQTVPETLQGQAFDLVMMVVGSPARSTVALIISIAISLLSASAYVRAFSRSSNVIYGRTEGRSWFITWLTMWGITLLLVLGGVLMVATLVLRESVIDAVLSPIARPFGLDSAVTYLKQILLPVWQWVRYPVLGIVGVALMSCLFYFAPNVRPGKFRLLTFGAAAALVAIAVMWLLFGWYLSTFGIRSAYGAFGTVLAVLVVIWAMNITLLLGVKLDAEILRAKQLQMGIDAEEMVQAAPRAQDAVLFRRRIVNWLHRLADDVKDEAADKRAAAEQERIQELEARD